MDDVAKWMRYSDEVERRHHDFPAVSYVWSSHDEATKFAPASDPQSGVHVVSAGRLCWSAEQWSAAANLPYSGGHACRLLLHRYLTEGASGIAPFNGAAAVLIWDPRQQVVHLWTDQFGYHPVFIYQKHAAFPVAITSFPDAIRFDREADSRLDLVSMAEFLRAWRATPPHTYFEFLKHAGAATHWQWDLQHRTVSTESYWQPFQSGFFDTPDEAANHLAEALRVAIGERTAVAEHTALFVSGGADSRVMVFGADNPAKVTGFNLYEDQPTAESVISKRLCERVGVKYVGLGRDADYYPRMLAENVRWSGGMWSAEDNHYLGMQQHVHETGADLVMTACTTDWVFKGYGLEKTYQKFLGKNLPLLRFTKQRVDGFLPNYPRAAPAEYAAAIDRRMQHWFADCPSELTTDLAHLQVEDRRIRPTCYTVSVSGQIMYRTFPYDTFLADSRIADCYSRIRAEWKLNGQVWGRAAARVCQSASDIVDSNHGWSVDASPAAKLMAFGRGWIRRRIEARRKTGQPVTAETGHPPSTASWPDLGWYASHSNRLQELWDGATVEQRQQLTQLWGSDPWAKPLNAWAVAPMDLFRILTLLQTMKIHSDIASIPDADRVSVPR